MNARRFMCGWPPPGKRKCNVPPIILCLLLGWSGVIAYDSLASAIPSSSLWLLAIGAFSTRLARSFMSGSACAFTTRSGMVLCCSRQVAIIRRSSLACPGNKRPVPRAHSRNRLDSDRAGRRRSGSCRRSLRRSSRLRRGRCLTFGFAKKYSGAHLIALRTGRRLLSHSDCLQHVKRRARRNDAG
jgi:hypothetical protein